MAQHPASNDERKDGGRLHPLRAVFVVEETAVDGFVEDVEGAGGAVEGPPRPFEPPAEELEDYSDPQFEPLMVVAVAVSAAYLIRTISKVWLDHKKPGGTIVDARTGSFEIRVAPHVERNTLVVLTDKKPHHFTPAQKEEGQALLQTLVNRDA